MDARITVTFSGEQGDLPDPIDYDSTDASIRTMVQEALRGGGIPGIAANATADLTDFVVDRFAAKDDLPARVSVRPKVPFGTL